jgi:hypothetical protein
MVKTCALILLTLAMAASRSHADEIVTVTANGTFSNNYTLDGTLTVDTTTGAVLSSALTVEGLGSDVFSEILQDSYNAGYADYYLQLGVYGDTPQLALVLDAASLVDYAGGIIFSLDDPGNNGMGYYYASDVYTGSYVSDLVFGAFLPVPEPATLPVTLGALLVVGIARRRTEASGAKSFDCCNS